MTDRPGNCIAGEWVAGAGKIENRNPSDVSDLIGPYAQEFYSTIKTACIAAGQSE